MKSCDHRRQLIRSAKPAAAIVADADRQRAVQLRLEGHTFREIAAAVGVSLETAHRYVNDGWERINAKTDEERTELRTRNRKRFSGSSSRRTLPAFYGQAEEDGSRD